MKFKTLIIVVISLFFVQILGNVLFFFVNVEQPQDNVKINDVLQECSANWDNLAIVANKTELEFSVIDNEGALLFSSSDSASRDLNAAVKNRDTILDVEVEGIIVGKLIVSNNYKSATLAKNTRVLIFNSFMLLFLCAVLVGYIIYINKRIIKPFNNLNEFATSISKGNLENELNMDRQNIFGAFTESFDIMRTEIKKAKDAEIKANESKKQLIANLSHDIKTPIASIKAIAELGECKAVEKDKQAFSNIIKKADQVNFLVCNLFSATLEEMNQLSINVSDFESGVILEMLSASDYLLKANISNTPEMLLKFDKDRLQQVFDNIISNSYKYALTPIDISFKDNGNYLSVIIKDYGGLNENGEKLTNKFYRGVNAAGKDGAGLGLFISDYLMRAMNGSIMIDCNKDYFMVTLDIKIS